MKGLVICEVLIKIFNGSDLINPFTSNNFLPILNSTLHWLLNKSKLFDSDLDTEIFFS